MEPGLAVFVGIVSDEKKPTREVVNRIQSISGVESIYELTGNLDVLVLARSDSASALNRIIEQLRAVDGVMTTTTYLVLESYGKE